MTRNYFAPHKIVAKKFRTPSKIVKYFSYPNHIRSARVPGIKNGRSLRIVYLDQCILHYTYLQLDLHGSTRVYIGLSLRH